MGLKKSALFVCRGQSRRVAFAVGYSLYFDRP